MSADDAFAVENVTVVRANRTLLAVDRLRIEPGRFVNVVGTNGAGKTTLLKVLCGRLRPATGRVWVGGVEMTAINAWQKSNVRKQIGYIPQAEEYNTQLPLTVREIVCMGRTAVKPLCRPLNREDRRLADAWTDRLGLSAQRNQTFRSLSGGEQQKALIARAMVQHPRILLLDEPTSNLDLNWKSQIVDLVTELQRQMNLTVLMISHEINALSPGADRTIVLDEGRLAADGPTAAVLASAAMERIYRCRIQTVAVDGRDYFICQNLPPANESD